MGRVDAALRSWSFSETPAPWPSPLPTLPAAKGGEGRKVTTVVPIPPKSNYCCMLLQKEGKSFNSSLTSLSDICDSRRSTPRCWSTIAAAAAAAATCCATPDPGGPGPSGSGGLCCDLSLAAGEAPGGAPGASTSACVVVVAPDAPTGGAPPPWPLPRDDLLECWLWRL